MKNQQNKLSTINSKQFEIQSNTELAGPEQSLGFFKRFSKNATCTMSNKHDEQNLDANEFDNAGDITPSESSAKEASKDHSLVMP